MGSIERQGWTAAPKRTHHHSGDAFETCCCLSRCVENLIRRGPRSPFFSETRGHTLRDLLVPEQSGPQEESGHLGRRCVCVLVAIIVVDRREPARHTTKHPTSQGRADNKARERGTSAVFPYIHRSELPPSPCLRLLHQYTALVTLATQRWLVKRSLWIDRTIDRTHQLQVHHVR